MSDTTWRRLQEPIQPIMTNGGQHGRGKVDSWAEYSDGQLRRRLAELDPSVWTAEDIAAELAHREAWDAERAR
jgi:hypothetical protein